MNRSFLRATSRLLVVITFSLASLVAPALASPAPSAAPSPAATACGSATPVYAGDFEGSFAFDLTSTDIQRFIALLGSASQAAQSDVIRRASAAARSPERRPLRDALARVCSNIAEAVGFSRAVIVISHEGNNPDLQDEKRADDLTDVLQTAVSALAHPDALTPDERAAAAAPFQALGSDAPLPEGYVTKPCLVASVAALPVRITPLSYPPIAQASRTTGTVLVKVVLSETGGVRSATLYSKTMGDDAGAEALVDAAIVVAASSTYEPARENCKPSPGAYLFKANFKAR